MEYRVVSAGNREELIQSMNELHLNPDNHVHIVSHDGLLIAFYYA